MDAIRLLDLLRLHLDACGARWMLAGGGALAAWGSTRALRDGPDLAFLLSLPGIDENEAREPFLRAGLLELWERLRRRS